MIILSILSWVLCLCGFLLIINCMIYPIVQKYCTPMIGFLGMALFSLGVITIGIQGSVNRGPSTGSKVIWTTANGVKNEAVLVAIPDRSGGGGYVIRLPDGKTNHVLLSELLVIKD